MHLPVRLVTILFLAATVGGCGQPEAPVDALPGGVEAISLLGDTLRPVALSDEAAAAHAERLAGARSSWERSPDNVDSLIWFGRRTAYPGQYRDAIRIYAEGIARWPEDARLYRHRGHRYVSVREFDQALADFRTAARLQEGRPDEIEPDGLPNARNIPTSTLQGNIWYHLGLTHYLQGSFDSSAAAFRRGVELATTADMLVAASHWLYMSLRRLGDSVAAESVLTPITTDMDIIENQSYHRLLLLYKGLLPVDSVLAPGQGGGSAVQDATVGYGVGNWHFYRGNRDRAFEIWRNVLAGGQWPAFGYVAAEADLAR